MPHAQDGDISTRRPAPMVQPLLPLRRILASEMSKDIFFLLFLICGLSTLVLAHDHVPEAPAGPTHVLGPIEGILWAHIAMMILAFGVLFPLGMVFPFFVRSYL